MKSLVTFTLLSALSSPAFAYDPDCSKAELEAYQRSLPYFKIGAITRFDLENARLNFIKSEFACRNIDKMQYCYEALQSTQMMLNWMKEEQQLGVYNTLDVTSEQDRVTQLEKFCDPSAY